MIALYARQSVERENSVSIETQLDYCKAMIKPDERSVKMKIFIDEGCSGGNTNREGFLKMMEEIERGRVRKVIVYKLDRISRSLSDFVGILQTFKEHQVEFVSSQESFDTSTIYGDLILKILIIFAEFERASIISRVRDAYAKRTDLGLYMGGRQQYGFALKDTVQNGIKTKVYVPFSQAVDQLQFIFETYAQEQVSLRQLQNSLLEKGMQPISGKDWTTAKLSSLLRNPVYVKADSDIYTYFHSRGVRMVDDVAAFTGEYAAQLYGKTTHNKNLTDWSDMKLVLMHHKGIISSQTWLRCQKRLEQNRQIGNSISNKTSWLSGKLICNQCGHTMTTVKSTRADGSFRRYFHCTGKSHKKTCTGVKVTLYADDIEAVVSSYIGKKLADIGFGKKKSEGKDGVQLNELKLSLNAIGLQEEALGSLLLNDSLNGDMIQIANQKAEQLKNKKLLFLQKIEEIKAEKRGIETGIDLTQRWKTAVFSEKKAVTGILIERIDIHENGSMDIIWNI